MKKERNRIEIDQAAQDLSDPSCIVIRDVIFLKNKRDSD